jgi:hypothetical protein
MSDDQKSDWYSLTAGENYYIEALTYVNNEDKDSFSTAVEIEQSDMTGHHHHTKEIQTIEVYVGETNKDTIRITIQNMDEGYFKLLFKNNWYPDGILSGSCSSTSTASELDSCLWYYMAWFCGGNDVTATFYDADGVEVDDPVVGGTGVYDMTSFSLMSRQCANEVVFIQESTTASITIQNSDEI